MTDSGTALWTIILAGGAGTRLSSLTRALYGVALPKQFAVLAGGSSMLQATVGRALALVPAERIVVVVTRPDDDLARRQLAPWPGLHIVVQPRGLDTGPGLILPLALIRSRDPDARVVVMPADHHVVHPRALIDAIERASAAVIARPMTVTLLGAEADAPDTDYGWIVPGPAAGFPGSRRIARFVEKPTQARAEALFDGGALWNTFVMIGRAGRLWALCERALPEHCARIASAVAGSSRRGEESLAAAYAVLGPANFSRAVLERADGLTVMPLHGAGWSDWGTPARVFASLRGTPDHDRLTARMPARVAASGAA